MTIGSVLFGLALAVMAGVLVADPFLRRGILARKGPDLSTAEQRRSVLLAIRDLDFDFRTGKVLAEDYQAWRARLLDEAAGWLSTQERAESELVQALEAQVAAIRHVDVSRHSCGHPLLGGEHYCPGCGESTAQGCPACGAAVHFGDRFCQDCGRPVARPGAARI